MATYKPNVVFDFDGVIHSYVTPWVNSATIPDRPVEGIAEAMKELAKNYNIVVMSSRAGDIDGRKAVEDYLAKYGMKKYVSMVTDRKYPAIVYIDDRAIAFDGDAKSLVKQVKEFKPWNRRV